MKQSVQDDSSSLLDVNAMSAVPEHLEDPNTKVSDSLSTYIADFTVKILMILTIKTRR